MPGFDKIQYVHLVAKLSVLWIGRNRPDIYIACSNSDKKKSTATVRSMPIARNRRAARKAKTEGNLGVGGASSCVARNRAKERQSDDTGRKRKRGRERRREMYASRRRGRDRGHCVVAKRTLVVGGARRSEREAQGRHGAARAHATHAYSAYAHGIHTALHKTGVCTDALEAHARAAA